MRLWIAEKPELGRVIANALGVKSKANGYVICENNNVVTWCFGHLIQSVQPKDYNSDYTYWDLSTLPMQLFPLKYQPINGKEKQVELIGALLKKASSVVNAGDVDDEGQLLVDELLIYHKWSGETKRVLISDMSEQSVGKAVHNLKCNSEFIGQYKKAYARAAGDFIYGLNMTRCVTLHAKKHNHSQVITLGRVQTPTLSLIVKRYVENKEHKTGFFYDLLTEFNSGELLFEAKFKPKLDSGYGLDHKKRLSSKDDAEAIKLAIKGKPAEIKMASCKVKETFAPLPYNLARLQQDMNNKFKFTADHTLKITQNLRENHACITYNRSDCSFLSMEQYHESPALLNKLMMLEDYRNCDFKNKLPKAFAENDLTSPSLSIPKAFLGKITAHTAIIPTMKTPDLSKLTEDEKRVYFAIADLYMAQFLPPKLEEVATAEVTCGNHDFSAKSTKLLTLGYEEFLKHTSGESDEKGDDSDDESNPKQFEALKQLTSGSTAIAIDSLISARKTTPPPLFTEATILSAMTRIADYCESPEIKKILKEKDKGNKDEHGSIGTPATRSAILENLKSRELIVVKSNKLIPTESSINLIKNLPKMISNPDLTALWFLMQQQIENNEITVEDFITKLYSDIDVLMESVSNMDYKSISNAQSCPACNGSIVIKDKLAHCDNDKCEFKIWRTIAEKHLTEAAIINLCTKGKTGLIKGFKSKAGKSFDAYLVLNSDKNGVEFKFDQPKKPAAKKSMVRSRSKVK